LEDYARQMFLRSTQRWQTGGHFVSRFYIKAHVLARTNILHKCIEMFSHFPS